MKNKDCVAFLRWCLPHLGLRWSGFRKVRGTVCKRIRRRLGELGLSGFDAYCAHLTQHNEEWRVLDTFCRIPISRFWRDRAVFNCLATEVLPWLAEAAARGGRDTVNAWCAGCASGEEVYSLRMAWRQRAEDVAPQMALHIVATDADETMVTRAKAGIYTAGSMRDLPNVLVREAFDISGDRLVVKPAYRAGITFRLEDIRKAMPEGPFDLVLCRNLAFTYFDAVGQAATLADIRGRLRQGGTLVVGSHEILPSDGSGFTAWGHGLPIYRRSPSRCNASGPT
jgi:chemotaxis protein methyltransferase CheR